MTYLTREKATEFIRSKGVPIAENGLKDWDYRGTGPQRVFINGRVLYTEEALLAWIARQAAQPVTRRRAKRVDSAA